MKCLKSLAKATTRRKNTFLHHSINNSWPNIFKDRVNVEKKVLSILEQNVFPFLRYLPKNSSSRPSADEQALIFTSFRHARDVIVIYPVRRCRSLVLLVKTITQLLLSIIPRHPNLPPYGNCQNCWTCWRSCLRGKPRAWNCFNKRRTTVSINRC